MNLSLRADAERNFNQKSESLFHELISKPPNFLKTNDESFEPDFHSVAVIIEEDIMEFGRVTLKDENIHEAIVF